MSDKTPVSNKTASAAAEPACSNPFLSFLRNIYRDMNICTHLLSYPYQWESSLDLGLRHSLLPEDSQIPTWFSTAFSEKVIYEVHDAFQCMYLAMLLDSEKTMLLIGPFTYDIMTDARIQELCQASGIPGRLQDFMAQYFASLPYIGDDRWNKVCFYQFAKTLWPSLDKIPVCQLVEHPDPKDIPYTSPKISSDVMIAQLEERYRNENAMMDYIANGDIKSADAIPKVRLNPRSGDSVRDMKNGMIILNTICRKAAENGQVHPVFLDEISRKVAVQIETSNSLQELKTITPHIIRSYCLLVQKHSLRKYSASVRNAINYISLHLDSDLSLHAISETLSLNSSYLSTLFRKETGETLTDFVTHRRLEHAIYLLNTSTDPIQDIAELCGFSDVNYFTRIFRREKGLTPSAYRTMIRK